MAACPYDRRFFNWTDPVQLPNVKNGAYDIFHETPAFRGTVMKCNFCPARTVGGGVPFCVEACPHGAFYFGDLEEDIATNGEDVVQLSRFLRANGAFRYKEELGTKPRVWYISGHSEAAEVREDAEREFPSDDGKVFMGDKLEWPWRMILAQTEAGRNSARASGSEASNG
jgi:molybdopterin-containing oxidoreductase family iron-sulfur binding subunit